MVDAFTWNVERKNRADAWLAWHIAALSRAKRLPPLKRLMKADKGRKLEGEELEKRRREHKEIVAKIDIAKINEQRKNLKVTCGNR